MRKIVKSLVSLMAAAIFLLTSTSLVSAANVGPQPASSSSTPDIIITTIIGSSTLTDLEVYNQSDTPINLAGWSFNFTIKDAGSCNGGVTSPAINFPSGWLLSKNYLTFENQGSDALAVGFSTAGFGAGCSSPWLSAVQVINNGSPEQTVNIPDGTSLANGAQQKQRSNSSSSARTVTGSFTSDYTVSKTPLTSLYSDPLYTPPADTAGLEVVEILPNSLSCGPTDTSLLCGDYVKLFNSSGSAIDLSGYRLRTSYDGLSSTSSNTVNLNGPLGAGSYSLVNTKNSGDPLSLTDTGGYVWLEDVYGAVIYQPVIEYPDASSASNLGQSWALNGSTWQWSSSPQPDGANYFPPDAIYGNAASSSSSSLTPCKPGQERNPLTNRCNSISTSASASASSQPCPAGQERNPATNRCRSIAATASTLKACQPGQARNPATNRCRKISASDLAKVQDIKTASGASPAKWYVIGGIVLAALGYAVYEWSQEIKLFAAKLKAKLPAFSKNPKA